METCELARRYRAGQTIVEIAAATGLGRGTVQRRLKRAGIALRPAGWRPAGGAATSRTRT